VRSRLFQDSAFCAKCSLRPTFAFPLGENYTAESGSLHDALRNAIAGRKSAILELQDGTHVRAKLSRRGGTATIALGAQNFNFDDSDLLCVDKPRRMKALKRVLAAKPLSADEEPRWHKLANERALSDAEFITLMTDLSATPEAFARRFAQPRDIDSDALSPDDPAYFDRLIAPLAGSADIETFIQGPLMAARTDLMRRHFGAGLRRIAYSALWQPLIPFELLRSTQAPEVQSLLAANDPFSLLCGFELCREGVSRDPAFTVLGTRFLEKLFDKDVHKHRCNLFAALAMITTVNIRRAIDAPDAPLWWVRLAVLTHAGVLTDAMSGMSNSQGFLKSAAEVFTSNYLWTTVIDFHSAPRWRPEWIDPD
jgi:hypothetical protein